MIDKYLAIIKKIFSPELILVLIFLLIAGVEAYLLYYRVYANLSTGIDEITVDTSVVRLDITNYKKILELLDTQKSYAPTSSIKTNPFK